MSRSPIPLPSYRMTDTDFALTSVDAYNMLPNGAGYGTELAYPYWDVTFTVHRMNNPEHGYWDGFLDALRGAKRSFLAYDANRPTPINYPNVVGMTKAGGGTFDGTGAISAITDINHIACTGFPATFQMLTGDYVGFVEDDKYSLHRLFTDETSDGSGHITLGIEPYLVTDIFSTAATVVVYHAQGEFILKPGSKPDRSRNIEAKPLTFAAQSRVM